MSTQVETRLPSSRPRRSLLPGPKTPPAAAKSKVRPSILPSPTTPNSGYAHLQIGQEVTTSDGKVGVLRFKGTTHFTRGFLCGIELHNAVGKNGGTVDGHYYFKCSEPHGVFVPAYKVFPSTVSGHSTLDGKSKNSKTLSTDTTVQSELSSTASTASKRLPRPRTLPFPGVPVQRNGRAKSGATSHQVSFASGGAKSSHSESTNRKVGPLNTSVTCPGWLGKGAHKSSSSRPSRSSKRDDTFTIPGDEKSNLESSYSARRKRSNSRKTRDYQQDSHVGSGCEPHSRLDSVPSYHNLSSIGGSDNELGAPQNPESAGVFHEIDDYDDDAFAPVGSPVTFDIGSQGSFGTWEDNSAASCGKSNSSLAWDFSTESTPVDFDLPADRIGDSRKLEGDDFLSTEDDVEYNEFLAIPSSVDTPTGRCKFDLLTPEELEQALNETNLLPEELRHQEEEPLWNLGELHKTPIWEPITPVEEEFLPFGTLDPNPLAFWSMDPVPVKSETAPEQDKQPTTEGNTEMELVTENGCLENGFHTTEYHDDGRVPVDSETVAMSNGIDRGQDDGVELPDCDLLEGVRSEDDNGLLANVDCGILEVENDRSAMVELVVVNGNMETSDSSSCSNKTVTENINGFDKLVDNVTDDLKIALKESERGNVIDIQSRTVEIDLNAQEQKRKSLLIKPKTGTKTTRRPDNNKGQTKLTKEKDSKGTKGDASKNVKPPVPAKPSVIPRRKTLEPGKASTKLAEVKSRINTGRKSPGANSNATDGETSIEKLKGKENTIKTDVKVSKRKNFQLRTDKDRVRKPSSSSAASDNSRSRADSRGSVNSSRPNSKGDVATDAKRNSINSKKKTIPPQNVTGSKKPPRPGTSSSQPPVRRVSQTKERPQDSNVTKVDAAPTRRSGFAVPAARKPPSTGEPKKRNIVLKDPKQAKIKKTRPHSVTGTPPDVVYGSIPDVRKDKEVKRLETLCNNQCKQLDAACQQIKVNAKAFETMAVLVQYLTQRCDAFSVPALKQKITGLEIQVKETSSQVASLKDEIARQGEELSETRRAHEVELETLKADHEQENKSLRHELEGQHQSEVDSLTQSHAEELEREAARFQKMEQTAESFKRDLEQQQMEHLEEVTRLEQEKERQKMEDECRHEQAVAKLNGDAKLREQVLQDEVLSMSYKCENLQDKIKMLEDALQKDSDARVQAAIEQFKHLPEEVESLKTVLSMKNKEIQEMRIKAADLEKQDVLIAEKDDKIKRLEAKVEDLNAMVESKISYERQLSSEHVILRENFEKESEVNKRLSMENEELHWKLSSHSAASSPGGLTPPSRFNPSPVPSSPLTSRSILRANSTGSPESGVFSPSHFNHN